MVTPASGAPSSKAVAQTTISLWSAKASRPIWVTWTQACTTSPVAVLGPTARPAGSTTTTSCPSAALQRRAQVDAHFGQGVGRGLQPDGLVHHLAAGRLGGLVLSIVLRQIALEGGPVGGLDLVGAHLQPVVVDGIHGQDRLFEAGSRVTSASSGPKRAGSAEPTLKVRRASSPSVWPKMSWMAPSTVTR